MSKITADFKIATPTKKKWSGVFGHTPDKPAQVKLLGEMFAVMAIKAEIDFDLGNLASLLQDELQSDYFKPATEPAKLSDFESALKSVKKRIAQIMEREPDLAEQGIDFEMLVGIIRENTLYLGVVGESKIMVARGDDVAEISGVLIDTELDGFVRTGSVKLEQNDRLLLMTSGTLQQLGESGGGSALSEFSIEDLKLKEGAAIILGYELDAKWTEKPEPEPEPEPEKEIEPVIAPEPETEQDDDEESEETEEVDEDLVDEIEGDEEDGDAEETEGMADKMKAGVFGALTGIRSRMSLNRGEVEENDEEYDDEYEEKQDKDFDDSEDEDLDQYDDYDESNESEQQDGLVGRLSSAPGALFGRLRNIRGGGENSDSRFEDEDDDDEDRDTPETAPASSKLNPRAMVKNVDAGKAVSQGLGGIKNLASMSRETIRNIRHGRPGSRSDYVRGGRRPGLYVPPKWRIVGVVMVVAIVVVIFGIRQTVLDNERRAYEQEILSQVESYEEELDRLSLRANTASIGTGQEAEKEGILRELDALATKAESLKSEELGVSTLDAIIDQVQTEKDTLLRVNAFTQPQVVTDLAVNFQGVDASDIEYSEGQLYVTDETRGVIYRMGTAIQSEANNFVTGLSKPRLLSVDEDGDLVFVDQGSESVIGTVDISDGSVRRQPGLSADRVGNLSAIFVWNNNAALYSINTNRPAVVKQNSVSGNYQIPGDSSVWRTDGEFATATDLAVDGSIYVMIKGQGLKRYFGGEPATMSLNGLLAADQTAIRQATKFELASNRLYIADPDNNRILVFSLRQGGEAAYDFEEQIVYRGTENFFTEITDIVVVPGQQSERLFVLDGPRVIRIDR